MSHKNEQNSSSAPEYEVEIPSREDLLEAIEARLKPTTFEEIVERFKLDDERQHIGLKRRLRAMERDGQLIYTKANAYGLPSRMNLIKGRIIGHRDGFGFCHPDDGGGDLFIPPSQMYSVLHGDRVLVQEQGSDSKGRREGRIVRVIEPRQGGIVGRFFVDHDLGIVVPDDSRLNQDILIPDDARNGARHGQIVVVEITRRPNRRTSPIGEITEILGEHMAPGMEIEVAIREHDIPTEWSAATLKEIEQFGETVPQDAYEDRVDLRELPLVTIDGEDSRDFDDAVCAEPDGDGWRLWVAIADVSYYVRPNTALDKDALERGNSVYFPNFVVPMLPEKLSNGLCSLNPDVDRLCMVAEMRINAKGKLRDSKFYPAVMKSHARLTYNKVADILDGDPKLRQDYQHVLAQIDHLNELFKVLKSARQQRSAIEFETLETRFIFNAQRKIESIEPVRRNVAHTIIEECMIMANVATARLIEGHDEAGALFRVHEPPSTERLTNFRSFLAELGLTMKGGDEPNPADYAAVLEQVRERADAELIQTMLLRSMQQAVYSPDNAGHFGLALEEYAHFTSPIRRYPDLVLHRAIKALLKKQQGPNKALAGAWMYPDEQLDELGEQCSMTERRADDATRQVADWLKCEYMQDHVGGEFTGVIASVTNFGLFIRIDDLSIDGLVHVSNLDNDYYRFDNERHLLIGENSRRVYRLGDKVKVKVRSVNLDERKIDLTLLAAESPTGKDRMPGADAAAGDEKPARKPRKKSSNKGKRGKSGAKSSSKTKGSRKK
ncbi:ribonuclease R [Pseudidiomarina sp. 1APP75-32.1]|uniref:Ribonuclease R n=1 Tax=Pseudidiomarina terrestris TaxID=2820060 RepID=A0AAW7QUA2_9GAMM|nr:MULTISPECIES: ribonuclease R [unclassified Pseudidiomarina]MDN7123830.1 ribonuclease R [Pseudidiomarina sp. 1APP75-32.1]MDN7127584.1 ribonuclease R [Pseudidiomarina sp. 1APR75-33.1]